MIPRSVAKSLIDFYLDRSKPLPSWLQRMVDQDHQLSKFQSDRFQMVRRLRSEADAWARSDQSTDQPTFSVAAGKIEPDSDSQRFAWKQLGVVGLAASLLALVLWNSWPSGGQPPEQSTAQKRQVYEPSQSELQSFTVVMSAVKKMTEQVSDRSRQIAAQVAQTPGNELADHRWTQLAQTPETLGLPRDSVRGSLNRLANLIASSSRVIEGGSSNP